MKTEQILAVIKEVEDYTRKLDESYDPSYYEREYLDAATEIFIAYPVEGYPELEVLFAERDHIKELRNKGYAGEIEEEEFEKCMRDINELSDQFDFGKVVGYSFEGSDINWL